MAAQRTVEILLVDDNIGDVVLTKEALKGAEFPNRVSVVRDGCEALEFLRRTGKFANASRPDLILLDINMPRKNGCEVLEEVRSDEDLRLIPIVILTSSEAEDDIRRSYELGANCFVTKPADLDEMVRVVQAINHFWITIAKLPRQL
ncbi:MAG: response regulator [Verrucomicrobia bacterium]|jgi:CheY-like chemotaxis protein|nr:response regulator [Verrucomicrobiota bacterium]